MLHQLVGLSHQLQRLPAMAQLPARLLATLAPQAARLRLARQSVAGRRLGTVVAILGQPGFQVLHALEQPGILLAQRRVLSAQQGDLFLWGHTSMLHLLRKSG